jgi:hypothetical protein
MRYAGRMSTLSEADASAIARQITGMVHALDARRWSELRTYFTEQVETDYTSLFGGEVQQQLSRELVDGWKKMLATLAATQHLLGPVAASGGDKQAVAQCHVRAYHYQPGATDGSEWMVAGHYVFGLEQHGEHWLISRMKLEAYYQTGNIHLLER